MSEEATQQVDAQKATQSFADDINAAVLLGDDQKSTPPKEKKKSIEELYTLSSEEGKRLKGVTKEQEAKIKALENDLKQKDELAKKFETYQPVIYSLENDQNFVQYLLGYDPQKGLKAGPETKDYGLGENLENFNPADITNPNTPTGKFMQDTIIKTASQIASQEVQKYDAGKREEDARIRTRQTIDKQIGDFLSVNKDMTKDEVIQVLKDRAKAPLSVDDVMFLSQRDDRLKKAGQSARQDITAQMKTAQAFPSTFAAASSSGEMSLADRIENALQNTIAPMRLLADEDE